MYSSPTQQPQQSPSMQRPPTMMNVTSLPQPNTAVGVPSMRPMVVSSPMQSSMMIRPAVGSPYGAVNRAAVFDKNKRPTYLNDPRQQTMVQVGQQSPMSYGNMGGPSQSMIPAGAGPMRQ